MAIEKIPRIINLLFIQEPLSPNYIKQMINSDIRTVLKMIEVLDDLHLITIKSIVYKGKTMRSISLNEEYKKLLGDKR